MASLIDLSRTDDLRDVVHRAVQALAEGKIVAFPSETVYLLAVSALHDRAVQRLAEVVAAPPGELPFSLAIRSADEAIDYAPSIPPVAARLARRCWPGPMSLVLDNDHPESVTWRLPQVVRETVCPGGTLALRVPAHQLVLGALRLMAGPLVAVNANRAGEPEAVTAQQIVAAFDGKVDLILDDGRSKFGQPASVIHVTTNRIEILRKGVITDGALKRLASFIVLFVCTGNTCRSPMAELLMKNQIATKLGCPIEELEDRGVLVTSAGIAAMAGGRPAGEAVQTMRERGLDLSGHESQPLSDRMLRFADIVWTMTRGHREAILSQWPDAASRTHLLSRDHLDIADPIGGPLELYRRCAEQIDDQLHAWSRQLNLETLLPASITERS